MVRKKVSKKIDEINKKSVKPLKVRFCPACRSTDVAFVFRFKNIFGLLPRVECYKCGNSGMEFPLLVVKADDLKKKKGKKVKGNNLVVKADDLAKRNKKYRNKVKKNKKVRAKKNG